MNLTQRWNLELDRLRELGRYRAFATSSGVDFTSNNYLGYASVSKTGVASTLPVSGSSSRLLAGHHPLWDELEARLAAWHRAESAIILTSGYAANEGLLSTILSPHDWIATDELNHACIADGIRLARPRKHIFRHNDLEHLESGLRAEAAEHKPDRQRFVVVESLYSMDGDYSPLMNMVNICERYGAYIIIDEAHSTGCLGKHGSGMVDELGLRSRVLATIHTGGKALGVTGAYICGSKLLREYLINKCRHLIFTTALPPIVANWWLDTLDRVEGDDAGRQRLHANARLFRDALSNFDIHALGEGYIVPIVLGKDDRAVAVARHLQERGYDVRAVRPPTVPDGTARIRISIHADHEAQTLRDLAKAIHEAVRI